MIALSPSSVYECYTLAVRAFNLSEKYRTPVILLMDEIIGHLREGVELPEELEIVNRPVYDDPISVSHPYHIPDGAFVPGMQAFGKGEFYNVTGLIHDEEGFPTNSHEIANKLVRRLLDKIKLNRGDIVTCENYLTDDADVVVVCFGGTARAAKEAVNEARERGYKAGMFRPVTVWPFPDEQLDALCQKGVRLIMAEHNDGQMLREVQRVAAGRCEIGFIGKVDGTVLTPGEILALIEDRREKEEV